MRICCIAQVRETEARWQHAVVGLVLAGTSVESAAQGRQPRGSCSLLALLPSGLAVEACVATSALHMVVVPAAPVATIVPCILGGWPLSAAVSLGGDEE